jgi:hypothetical protein
MKVPNAMFEFNVTDENTPVSDDYVNNQWASTIKISLGVKQQSHTHTRSNQRKVKLVFVASRISNYWLVYALSSQIFSVNFLCATQNFNLMSLPDCTWLAYQSDEYQSFFSCISWHHVPRTVFLNY